MEGWRKNQHFLKIKTFPSFLLIYLNNTQNSSRNMLKKLNLKKIQILNPYEENLPDFPPFSAL